jgi:hypothetical protein
LLPSWLLSAILSAEFGSKLDQRWGRFHINLRQRKNGSRGLLVTVAI